MKRSRIVIRADADSAIGMGHVVRCLTLARELTEHGAEVHLAAKSLPEVLEQRASDLGVTLWMLRPGPDDEATLEILSRLSPVDMVIVDHYGLDEAWEQAVRPRVARLMVIDDLASRAHCCDVLLDQNYAAPGVNRYQGLVPVTATLWLGPSYALIRREFPAARAKRREQADAIRTIAVSFGGFASPELVRCVVDACALRPLSTYFAGGTLHVFGAAQDSRSNGDYSFKVCEHRFSGNMAGYLADSDLAIGAGGGGLWERLCIGVPSMVTILADNQRPGVEALAKDGYLVNLGDASRLDATGLCNAICALRDEPGVLHGLFERGRRLVDGEGARRVAAMLLQ